MNFHVSLSQNAHREVDEILGWIVQRSFQGAMTWSNRWNEVLRSLGEFADRCSLAPESEPDGPEIRHTVFRTRHGRPYRALFVIRDDKVIVIHVRGPGQDLLSTDDLQLPDA